MSSFLSKAKQMARKAKERVVDSAKQGYGAGEKQGSRAADTIEHQTAASSADVTKQTTTNMDGSGHESTTTTDSSEKKTPQWKNVVTKTGGVLGALAGGTVGVGRALYGVPKDFMREKSKNSQEEGLKNGWGPREMSKISSSTTLANNSVRVVCVRHGHGFHNDVGGLSNVGNRDALLSPLGIEQAKKLKDLLSRVTFDMLVVSPMRRTLETSLHVLGEDVAAKGKLLVCVVV
jgi:hypothetical protein